MSFKSGVDTLVPESVAWRVVDPILSVFASLSSDETETFAYHGRGKIEYIGDADERELGEYQALAGVLPAMIALLPMFFDLAFIPDTLYTLPWNLALGAFLLLTIRVMDKVELTRVGGEGA